MLEKRERVKRECKAIIMLGAAIGLFAAGYIVGENVVLNKALTTLDHSLNANTIRII